LLLEVSGAKLCADQQAVVLTPAMQLSCKAPLKPIAGDLRIELRAHAMTPLAGQNTGTVLSIPGFRIRWMGSAFNAPFLFTDDLDEFARGLGTGLYLNPAGSRDVVLRLQRRSSRKILDAEIWNADGSGYKLATLPIARLASQRDSAPCEIGGNSSLALDYIRLYNSAVPTGTSPFLPGKGDLLDLEFEGTLVDEVTGARLKTNTTPVFTPSPSYPPAVTQGPPRTFTNGHGTLDGSQSFSLAGEKALSLSWEQVSGPSPVIFSSKTSAQPQISGMSPGSYVFRLTGRDSIGKVASVVVKYGDVSVDARGRVIPAAEWEGKILGPLLPWGANPWPYFDESHQRLADFFGALLTSDYLDVWNRAGPGTIAVSKGSAAIAGSNTRFRKTFCKGGSVPVRGASLVVWYPVPGAPGHTGRRAYAISACDDDTRLTLRDPWITSASARDLNYAAMDESSIGAWINGSTNANYYDNGLAHLNLSVRSGIDTYRQYFRTLEDRWWTMPWIDEGRVCADGEGRFCLAPRLQSLTGLIARALDGRPDMWPGIRALVGHDLLLVSQPPFKQTLGDMREEAYATAFVALLADLDPDPVQRKRWKASTASVVANHWIPAMLPNGIWQNRSQGGASWNGAPGTVSVTHGSPIVIGSGTEWRAPQFENVAFWTASLDGITGGDKRSYFAVVNSPTQLTLNTPYEGPTASGRGWQANILVGSGTEPFMLGVVGTAFRYAYQATGDPRLPGMIGNIAAWLASEGYRPSTHGLWYGRGFPNCEPVSDTNRACNGGSVEESRFLSGEVISTVSAAYAMNGNASLRAFGDKLYAAEFAKNPTDPGFDGTYVNDFDGPQSWDFQTRKAKDFGFFFGFGAGSSWPASR
jgi:hypothetical protein